MTTLATRTLDGVDVLILKEGQRILFVPVEPWTQAAHDEAVDIRDVFHAAQEGPVLLDVCPQVERFDPSHYIPTSVPADGENTSQAGIIPPRIFWGAISVALASLILVAVLIRLGVIR